MKRDAQVETAIAHWAPRFIANGVALADFEDVTNGIARWDDWCAAWCARAGVHEELGRESLERAHLLSAADHLSRAAVYYHFAKFVFVQDIDQMRRAHDKAIECKQLALPFLSPPARRVEIPYEGGWLAGFLRLPAGAAKPPVVVMVPGLDSAKEELESYETPFLARGMATLMIDGPGQGEAEYRFPIRGDYEVAVTAVVDWLQSSAEVDAARVGLWGVSLGGYYATRAVAFEHRILACVGLSGPYDFLDNWQTLPNLSREVFRVRSHSSTMADAQAVGATLTLKGGIAAQIECPLLLVTGKQDRLIDWKDALRVAEESGGPVELMVIEDGNHIANNRTYRYRNQTADWMASQLGLPKR